MTISARFMELIGFSKVTYFLLTITVFKESLGIEKDNE